MRGREDCCVHRQRRADRDVLRCALLSGQACQDRWRAWLDQAFDQGQAGQVGTAAAAGLVPDPVQVRADRAGADAQLGGDLALVRPWATSLTSSRSRALSCPEPCPARKLGSVL